MRRRRCAAGSATRAAAGRATTLVVDTTNFTDKNPFRGSGESLHLTERFTRTDANTLLYEFTVDDPATFTRPWTAQLPMTQERRADLRVRLPRGQLRAARHPARRKISGTTTEVAAELAQPVCSGPVARASALRFLLRIVNRPPRGLPANSPLGCSAKRCSIYELNRLRARAGARSRPPAPLTIRSSQVDRVSSYQRNVVTGRSSHRTQG